MIPTRWNINRNSIFYGETRFGFVLPGCSEEICSLSTAKLVVEKFQSLILDLSNDFKIDEFDDGSREITVNGDVLATFAKEGRYFDINLSRKQY